MSWFVVIFISMMLLLIIKSSFSAKCYMFCDFNLNVVGFIFKEHKVGCKCGNFGLEVL
jgi:hypothetical protein